MRFIGCFCRMKVLAPPPLTGGGWGVGEIVTAAFHGNFPLTPTLSRKGRGRRAECGVFLSQFFPGIIVDGIGRACY